MTRSPQPAPSPPDDGVDGRLNRFVYGLYAGAGRPGGEQAAPGAIVSDAGLVDAILRAPDRFQKNFSLIAALGHSRFSTNGEEWRQRRDLTQPVYARAGVPGNRATVAATYAEALEACAELTPQAVQRALLLASTRIFFLAFGCNVATEPLLDVFARARRVLKQLQYYSWVVPTAGQASLMAVEVKCLFADFEREVARAPELQKLVQGLQRSGGNIDNFAALEEILMNVLAGIETTAATLSFAIDRLGIDARVQRRLRDEVDAGAGPYLDCFINETMRYFPPIPFVVRQATADTAIGGTEFKQGKLLVLSVVGVHHDPRFWREPEIFDSARAEFIDDSYDRRAFLPFLAGPRMCGGAKLAGLELREGLKAFIRRFNVERQGDEIQFDYGVTLRPNSWDRVTISRRTAN